MLAGRWGGAGGEDRVRESRGASRVILVSLAVDEVEKVDGECGVRAECALAPECLADGRELGGDGNAGCLGVLVGGAEIESGGEGHAEPSLD